MLDDQSHAPRWELRALAALAVVAGLAAVYSAVRVHDVGALRADVDALRAQAVQAAQTAQAPEAPAPLPTPAPALKRAPAARVGPARAHFDEQSTTAVEPPAPQLTSIAPLKREAIDQYRASLRTSQPE